MSNVAQNIINLPGLFSPDGIKVTLSDMDEINLAVDPTTECGGIVSRYDMSLGLDQPTYRKIFLKGIPKELDAGEVEQKLLGDDPEWVIWGITLHLDHITISYHDKGNIGATGMINIWAETLTLEIILKANFTIAPSGITDELQKIIENDKRQNLKIEYSISGSGECGNTRTMVLRMFYGDIQFSTFQYSIHALNLLKHLGLL